MPEFEEDSKVEVEEVGDASDSGEVVGAAVEYEEGEAPNGRGKSQARYSLKRGRLPQAKKADAHHGGEVVDVNALDVTHDAIGSRAERPEPVRGHAVKKSTEVVFTPDEKKSTAPRPNRSDARRDAPKGDQRPPRHRTERPVSHDEKYDGGNGAGSCACGRGKFCHFLGKLLAIFGIKSKRCKGPKVEVTGKKHNDSNFETKNAPRPKRRHGRHGFPKKT